MVCSMFFKRLTTLLLAALLSCLVLASSGDRAPDFSRCVTECIDDSCASYNPPLLLRLTRLSCTDDCRYICMHTITDHAIEDGVPMQKYYGKWPFWRYAGMQEPASAILSFAKLLLHIWGLGKVRKNLTDEHPMKRYYVRWAYINCNACIWTAIFHTRDTPFTAKSSYVSAHLSIFYALYFLVVRLLGLYSTPSRPAPPTFHLWTMLCILANVLPVAVACLSQSSRIDYERNLTAFTVLGLLNDSTLWLAFAVPDGPSPFQRFGGRPRSYRPRYARRAAQAFALNTLAMMLEVFDFPPWWRVVDAHLLSHLATAPVAVLWYDFLISDGIDAVWKEVQA